MKILAFYLPQYHEVPENNKWWGEGFTDWVNVKKAKKLYKNHNQPKIPINGNYYNLSDCKEFYNQIKIAKEYGIGGFCFYHYWFNGKKLLEVPIENFLNNKDLDIEFCLSWANEPWTRSWDGKESNILIDQYYGKQKQWNEHFSYLLKFFNDKRYIKVNDKPMFLIYRSESIPNCDAMIEYWDEMCRKHGFKGIHVVETLTSFQNKPKCDKSEAVVEFEPMFTMKNDLSKFTNMKRAFRKILFRNKPMIINYEEIWKRIIKRNYDYGKNKYLGAFVGWDNTPRKGLRGCICTNQDNIKFGKYLEKQIEKCEGGYIFINAWNEWAEGAYLEPDENDKFTYLEELKNVLSIKNNYYKPKE